MTITRTFDFHVDPSHYNFIFTDPMYITVAYDAVLQGDELLIACKIEAPLCLVTAITLAGNWSQVNTELQAAARHNAETHIRNRHVDEIILGALVPHI